MKPLLRNSNGFILLGVPLFRFPSLKLLRFQWSWLRLLLLLLVPALQLGYRPALLQQCLRAESFSFLSALTAVVNLLASGRAPLFLQSFLAGGVSIALEKSNNGVRPLCCGDPLRRLVGKCFCLGGKDDITKEFSNKNFGVGCPGGVEVVAHSLRNVLEGRFEPNEALLKLIFATRSI